MKLLKIDMNIPFWCSFTEYGTLNLKQTYPFPPPPTIFGIFLNAMGKPAPHTIGPTKARKKYVKQLIQEYENLLFSISIIEGGLLIEDYLNILKGSRESEEVEEKRKKQVQIRLESGDSELTTEDRQTLYKIHKRWIRTQVSKQRLINPRYRVFVGVREKNWDLLDNIFNSLKQPRHPLYLGESDDVVDLQVKMLSPREIDKEHYSDNISSVLPGLYANCQICKIPILLRYEQKSESKITCSIPKGNLQKEIKCINADGENIVPLRSTG